MKTVFVGSRGNVVKLKDPHFGANDVGLIRFEELTKSSPALILTDMGEQFKPRYQITDTLGDRTLLHTFGRSMNVRRLSGLCYESFCEDADDKSGYEDLNEFFNANNAVVRDTPITMVIGKSFATKGFILTMAIELADPVARIWSFTLDLITDPGTAAGALQQAGGAGNPADEQLPTLIQRVPRTRETISDTPFFQSSTGQSTYTPTPVGTVLSSGDQTVPATTSSTTQRMVRQAINPFIPVNLLGQG